MLHELLKWILLLVAGTVAADEQAASARAGQDAGMEVLQKAAIPGFVAGGERAQGTLHVGTDAIPVNQLIPGGDRDEQLRLAAMVGDAERLQAAASMRLATQASDSSDAAIALREAAAGRAATPSVFVAREPFLATQSIEALTHPLTVAPEVPACRTEVAIEDATAGYTRFHERTCEQVQRPGSCTRTLQIEDLSDPARRVFAQRVRVAEDLRLSVPVRRNLPPDTLILSAAFTISWSGDSAGVDWAEPPSADNHWTGVLHLRALGGPCAACSVDVAIDADVRALRQRIHSAPEQCLVESDGFCSARFTCHAQAQPIVGGQPVTATEAAMLIPLYPPDPLHDPPSASDPLCMHARARYECRINTGEFCIDTPTGRHCTINTDDNTVADTCAPLLATEPGCTLAHVGCAGSAIGHGGWCYVRSSTYRCPESIVGPAPRLRISNPCSGQIRCAGDDCLDRRFDETGFATVADGMAGMMVAQVMTADWALAGQGLASDEPTLLPGRAYECRKALGGAIDCCDQTETGAEEAWFDKYQRHMRRANGTASLARYADQGPHGSWKLLAETSDWSLDQLGRPLTSGPETVTAGIDDSLDPEGNSIVGATPLLQPMNDEFIEESRLESMQEVGWACSAPEFDLARQRELGHCLNLGSYCHATLAGACLDKRDVFCCFSSSASRLLRETIAGPDAVTRGVFGTPRAPRCDGITVAQARPERLDVADLKGRLVAGGVVPDTATLRTRSGTEKLTGSGSNLADGARPTVQQRTAWRMARIDGAGVRDDLHDEARTQVSPLGSAPSPGLVSFSPAFVQVIPGRTSWVGVLRQGSSGAASVRVRSEGDTPFPVDVILHWSDGQSGLQHVRLDIPDSVSGTFHLTLALVSGGVIPGANERATIQTVMP